MHHCVTYENYRKIASVMTKKNYSLYIMYVFECEYPAKAPNLHYPMITTYNVRSGYLLTMQLDKHHHDNTV